MECLPRDLWIQIFVRLPVKTIMRCLSVCKSWQLFILHPSFINSHLKHQRSDLIFVRSIPDDIEIKHETTAAKRTKPECYSFFYENESFTFYAKHEFPILHYHRYYRIVGSCNRIICITNDLNGTCHDTYLWNPTIQKCVELPRPMFTFDEIGGFEHELGFGFDKKTNDYKVVRLVDAIDQYKSPLEVEIYSLSSGIWRKASHLASGLGIRIFYRTCTARNYQVYLNGSLHWVGRVKKKTRCMIIAFDLGDEVFRCFESPFDKECNSRRMENLRPDLLEGSLSLIHCSEMRSGEQIFSIWIMKDYGDSTSWTKYVGVDLSYNVDRVIGLRKKCELLIEIKGGLYSYKPTEGKKLNYLDKIGLCFWKLLQESYMEGFAPCFYDYDPEFAPKELGIKSKTKDGFRYSFHSESYTESLVLLGRMNSAKVAMLQKKKLKGQTKKTTSEVYFC